MAQDVAQRPIGGRVAGLIVGDLSIFWAFAYVGRSAHEGTTSFGEISQIAAPFGIAWLLVAPWLGMYRPEVANAWRPALQRTTVAWAIAGPLGLGVRRVVFKDAIPVPFIITTLLINLVLLLGWRAWTARKFAGR